jgi:orotidine-5'-phosphate decarboxylase
MATASVTTFSISAADYRAVDPAERLIVALDVSSKADAIDLIRKLDGVVSFFKIGLQLQLLMDLAFLDELIESGKRIFLDYKYNDIPRTVKEAVGRAADLGVEFLTVHGSREVVKAAVEGRGRSRLKLLSVTVLTSLDRADLAEMGFDCSVEDLVIQRARAAQEAGCDGVIASGQEAEAIKRVVGDKLLIVTPGIRPDGELIPADDQKRVMSARAAIRAGADYLVIGRPIYASRDPVAAAKVVIEEMRLGFAERD